MTLPTILVGDAIMRMHGGPKISRAGDPSAWESELLGLEWRECQLETCSLYLPKNLTREDWLGVGISLGRLGSCISWWLGDWWLFGEFRYGERKAMVEADGWEGPSFQTCMNVAAVCKAFETSRRREALSFSHHAEVAGLHPNEADPLLDFAEATIASTGRPRSVGKMREERWSRHHAAKAMEDAAVGGRAMASIATDPVATRAGARFIQDQEPTRAGFKLVARRTDDMEQEDTVHWPQGTQTDDQAIAMVMAVVKRITATLPISDEMRSKLANIRFLPQSRTALDQLADDRSSCRHRRESRASHRRTSRGECPDSQQRCGAVPTNLTAPQPAVTRHRKVTE